VEVGSQLIVACGRLGSGGRFVGENHHKKTEEENNRGQKKQKKMARRYDARTTIFSPEGTSARAAKAHAHVR
jgi:hypothetical protein